jgi:predicted RNase H-like nuclease
MGVDLAWAEGSLDRAANETGVVAVDASGEIVDAGWTVGLGATVEWMSAHAVDDTLAMIDAPLVVTNLEGQRTCERAVGRSYGRWKVSANSTNLSSPRLAGQRLRVALAELGWMYDPGWSGPHATGRRVLECYPYATLVGASEFGYERERPVYKRRPKRMGTAEFRVVRARVCDDLTRRIAELRHADPPLFLESHPLTAQLVTEPSPLADRQYKHREDLIDALICAWTGLVWLRWGLERCQVLGDRVIDPQSTIIAPARTSQRDPDEQVAGSRLGGEQIGDALSAAVQPAPADPTSRNNLTTAPKKVQSSSTGPRQPHECRCATLPASWPKCGRSTKSVWSPGCDGRSLDAALRHLGFGSRTEFIEWAAQSPPLGDDSSPS